MKEILTNVRHMQSGSNLEQFTKLAQV